MKKKTTFFLIVLIGTMLCGCRQKEEEWSAQTIQPIPIVEVSETMIAMEKEKEEPVKTEEWVFEKEVDLKKMQEENNPDIYAWIYIPDTEIDYPILQHATDNSYYLNYNMDGTKGYPGCIYSENYNAKDFSDPVTILYGHNMKDGSMFAGLHQYEEIEYFRNHSNIYIYVPEGILVYEIFAAYEYRDWHILLNHDFDDKEAYQKYVEEIYTMKGNFNTEIEVNENSKILTLSTCDAEETDKRYLVQGVLSRTIAF